MTGQTAPRCPHCDHELDVGFVSELRQQSTVHFQIKPTPGELLDAATVGGTPSQMRDLLVSFGKGASVPTDVLVKSVTTLADGTIDIELVVARFELAEERRARFAAREGDAA